MTKVAQASCSEFYGAWGEPGNQLRTEKGDDGELNIVELGTFTKVFRLNDVEKALQLADLAVRCVKNKLNGYAQNNGASPRDTLRKELQAVNWVPEDIKHPCNCDCSSLVSALCQALGLAVPDTMYTGNAEEMLVETGAFTVIPITKDFKYQIGDVVWRPGHMAIVCEVDRPDMVTTGNVNMRVQPVSGTIIKALPPGTGVKLVAANPWYQVTDGKNTGWVSGLYLKKT